MFAFTVIGESLLGLRMPTLVNCQEREQSVGALGELLINYMFVATSWDGF